MDISLDDGVGIDCRSAEIAFSVALDGWSVSAEITPGDGAVLELNGGSSSSVKISLGGATLNGRSCSAEVILEGSGIGSGSTEITLEGHGCGSSVKREVEDRVKIAWSAGGLALDSESGCMKIALEGEASVEIRLVDIDWSAELDTIPEGVTIDSGSRSPEGRAILGG